MVGFGVYLRWSSARARDRGPPRRGGEGGAWRGAPTGQTALEGDELDEHGWDDSDSGNPAPRSDARFGFLFHWTAITRTRPDDFPTVA